jgi:NADH-quinone oxidoreductase subunit N
MSASFVNFYNIYFLHVELILLFILTLIIIVHFIDKLYFKEKGDSKNLVFIIIILIFLIHHLLLDSVNSPKLIIFFYGYFIYSNFIVWLKIVMLIVLIFYFVLLLIYNQIIKVPLFEYIVLILTAFLGSFLFMISNHLFVMFVFLELVNLCLYCLIGLNKYSNKGIEASFKYFVQSSLATIVGFFGISLIYLSMGTLFIHELHILYVAGAFNNITILGLTFILFSLFFKMGLFPFHSWLPEVYQGSLLLTAAFIAIIPKTAYILVFLRLIVEFYGTLEHISFMFAFFSVIYGSIITLYQTTFRRLIAYGSMVHLGFIIMSISLHGVYTIAAAIFYLLFYIYLTVFNFAIMIFFFERNYKTLEITFIDDLSRLSIITNKNKLMIFFFSFILFSFAGLPVFVGFISK